MDKNWTPSSWRKKDALHMPKYLDETHLNNTLEKISKFPPLVFAGEARLLKEKLSDVAQGKAARDGIETRLGEIAQQLAGEEQALSTETTERKDESATDRESHAAALQEQASKRAKEKASILRNFYDLLCSNQDDLAKILTYEQGKPLAEAIGEIAYSASFIEWFAEEAKRVYGDLIPGHMHDRRTLVIKQPVGVVASITPWNFPSAMLARKVGPALATGCSLVCKPAKQTPFSALAFAYLAEEAGVPKGLLNVLTGNAQTIGKALTDSEVVRKLTFTGSTEIGKMLLKECANTVKRVSMELGGHAPFIVFEDADIEAAIQGAIAAKQVRKKTICICGPCISKQTHIFNCGTLSCYYFIGNLGWLEICAE